MTDQPEDQPTKNHREQAEVLYTLTCQGVGEVEDRLTDILPAELAARSRTELLLSAQSTLLQAVYHELRHGHDQLAEHTAALKAHTKALNSAASAEFHMARHLAGNADAMNRASLR
ncbi:hypothetical protein GCM10010174_80670 [Kutzneria viridogrisea]|uniref:Excreted virulence factor EspC, type VII ESX diderm n=1 Tax=Kutzneria viridogrisea TaxID=47990 RepID=A0ABR6BYY0_9PSEU|nr:hypothetical protein [Kutzneria viridogrisea]